MNQATALDYDFPVQLQTVLLTDGTVIPHAKAIVRSDNGKPIGHVVTDRYKIFTHKECVEKVQPFISGFGDAKVQNFIERDGARFIREYTFNEVTLPVKNVNDVVHMRLQISNSYGLRSSVQINLAAMVLRCLNGMMVPEGLFDVSIRHAGGDKFRELELPDPEAIRHLFKAAGNTWNEWAERDVTPEQQGFIVAQALKLNIVSKKTLNEHKALLEPSDDSGRTFWQYYNNYTDVLTHKMPSRLQHSSRIGRLARLNAVFAAAGKGEVLEAVSH